MLAEVQDILTGLVLEYLRSTFHLASAVRVPQPTYLEWLTLLRNVASDLERSVRHIALHPIRAVNRQPEHVPSFGIRRVDSQVRRQVLHGGGQGPIFQLSSGVRVRDKLQANIAHPTLDTSEHRWLARQLRQVRQRLAQLRETERMHPPNARGDATQAELSHLEQQVSELLRVAPFVEAKGDPPAGFASLQLLSSPGYREAYKACLILSLGLRLTGGPVRLSLKDLSVLYEYWCYLAILKIVAGATGRKIPARQLLAVEQDGLRVLLQKGKEKTVPFELSEGRRVAVTYNPRFQSEPLLVAQQPDFVLSLFDRDWPTVGLVVDAKYRVDSSPEFVERYGSPGPPDDAVNVLHRYRDAILDIDRTSSSTAHPMRTVIQGLAIFPYREARPGTYSSSRLWMAVRRLGIGAIPALPGHCQYLQEWLEHTLRMGGWALSERAIPHRSHERATDWRIWASEPVLIGVLRGDAPQEHYDWINKTLQYYMPATRQPRQFFTKHVAIYVPATIRRPGAVLQWAPVKAISAVRRGDIRTPWTSRQQDALQVLYALEPLRPLPKPIENLPRNGRGGGPRTPRWTSRLGLLRASNLQELMLETEPEWRLYEDLRAAGVEFTLDPSNPTMVDPEDPRGRAWFLIDGVRIQYSGAAGFLCRTPARDDQYVPTVDVSRLRR
jgi:hypothetical protein